MIFSQRISPSLPAKRLLISAILALLALAAFAAGSTLAAPAAQEPVDPPSARNGHALWQENCAACHGVEGLGDGPTAAEISNVVPVLADPALARSATLAGWFDTIKNGRMDKLMPPWKNRLTDQEIWDVAAFAYSLHVSDDILDRGGVVWNENCAACHGPDGAGDGEAPSLTDQALVSNSTLDGWFEVSSNGRGAMSGFADSLPTDDLWAALEYARTFSYVPMTAAVLPKGDGRLVGSVQNGTPGGPPVANLTVTLRSFQHFDEMRAQTVEIGAEGQFVFENLPTDENFFYIASTEYNGVSFSTDFITFEPDTTEQALTLKVYESSDTPGEIKVELAQWFVELRQGSLLVGELYRVAHDSDSIFTGNQEVVPGKKAVVAYELPAGVSSLSVDGGQLGDRFIVTETGFVDTAPLAPGQSQLLIRYLLPYNGAKAGLSHAIPYDTGELSVLVPQGANVQVEGLEQAGTQTVGDAEYISYQTTNLPAGQAVSFSFSDLDKAQASAAPATPNSSQSIFAHSPALLYGLSALVAVLVFGLLALILLRSRSEDEDDQQPAGETDLVAEQKRLLQAIADLDDSHAAGELDDDEHQALRQAQKRALLVVTRQLDDQRIEEAA